MFLRVNEGNYTLELGYDFKFLEYSYLELLWNVVNCFCDHDEMTLFGYTEYDKDLYEYKEEMASGFLKAFHTHGDYNDRDTIIIPIKEMLYKHYSDLTNGKKAEKNREEVFTDFRNTPLKNLEPLLKNEIEEFLYSNLFTTQLTDEEEEFQQFAKQRISFISREWDFPPEHVLYYDQPNDFKRTLWVNLKGKSEVTRWLNRNSWFTCVILERGKPLSEYDYFLTYGEREPEPTMVLEIVERRKGHFLNIVLPRLQKIFNNNIVNIV